MKAFMAFENIFINRDEYFEYQKSLFGKKTNGFEFELVILYFIFMIIGQFFLEGAYNINLSIREIVLNLLIDTIFILILVAFIYFMNNYMRRIIFNGRINSYFKRNWSGKSINLQFYDEGLVTSGSYGTMFCHYSDISELCIGIKSIFLKFGTGKVQIIPKRYFCDESAAISFVEILRHKLLSKKLANNITNL